MPTVPPPVTINHPLLFAIGTAIWTVALVVLVTVHAATGHDLTRWIWIAGTGTGLGVVAIVYVRLSWRARQ